MIDTPRGSAKDFQVQFYAVFRKRNTIFRSSVTDSY